MNQQSRLMPEFRYSFRLKRKVWMLDDEDYAPIGAAVHNYFKTLRRVRLNNEAMLGAAAEHQDVVAVSQQALALYEDKTGLVLAHALELPAVRASLYGPDCHVCSKPLRTPRAKLCAACGEVRATESSR